jgi:hypothetical protein
VSFEHSLTVFGRSIEDLLHNFAGWRTAATIREAHGPLFFDRKTIELTRDSFYRLNLYALYSQPAPIRTR